MDSTSICHVSFWDFSLLIYTVVYRYVAKLLLLLLLVDAKRLISDYQSKRVVGKLLSYFAYDSNQTECSFEVLQLHKCY